MNFSVCGTRLSQALAAEAPEYKLKLQLTVSTRRDVTVVHCKGRIVYRNEAAALSQRVGQLFHGTEKLVLDLSCVEAVDSAGLGELVVLYLWAQARGSSIKLAAPGRRVLRLLQLTNLASVFAVHPTLEEAIASCSGRVA